ncbi:terminase large subunit [Ligilactobacillus cholophilus]|uniref:terminase large subunit n=1 Tax=Ligilactobacillus cholophilus TaxID=3050131 RepID=UPI0025B19612|nr:terminase TerL endonuclease subunit [Ligilactobacillus cholophilus]
MRLVIYLNNRVQEYADKVLNNEIITCTKVKQACDRFIKDLAKQRTKDFPYYFNEELVNKIFHFVELLPRTDGKPLKLELFQCFILGNLYGWRSVKDDSRRFNRCLLSFARKNGKTFLIAIMGIIELLLEKDPPRGRQVLFTANSSKQAHLAFDMMADQLHLLSGQSKIVRQRVKINKQIIEDRKTNSFAVPLATDKSSLDGYNPTLGVVDEFHSSKNRDIINVLKSGMVQQPNSLLAIISTAGFNTNSPFKEECDYVSDILSGEEQSDRYFGVIYTLDDKEEVNNPDCWIKANPLLSNNKVRDTMFEQIKSDVEVEMKQENMVNVMVKNMNVFMQAQEDSFISASDWEKGKTKRPNIKGKDIYIGIDLSKSNDLTAVSWIIPINGKFYCDSHSWVGTHYGLESKIKRDGIDYISLEHKGECTITKLDSGVIDYDDVFSYVQRLILENELNVKYICYDPWNFAPLLTKFEKEGYPLFEVRQGTKTMNIPTRDFREKLYNGKIKHYNNKILSYSISNAILKVDNNGVIIDKARNSNRIDPVDALLNAYVACMNYFDNEEANKQREEIINQGAFIF